MASNKADGYIDIGVDSSTGDIMVDNNFDDQDMINRNVLSALIEIAKDVNDKDSSWRIRLVPCDNIKQIYGDHIRSWSSPPNDGMYKNKLLIREHKISYDSDTKLIYDFYSIYDKYKINTILLGFDENNKNIFIGNQYGDFGCAILCKLNTVDKKDKYYYLMVPNGYTMNRELVLNFNRPQVMNYSVIYMKDPDREGI